MIFKALSGSNASGFVLRMRCPGCKQRGTFEPIIQYDAKSGDGKRPLVFGQRRCPDPDCRALVFFVSSGNEVLVTYPAERIDFDATSIPERVVSALHEALTCHAAGCYVAAAIMVRKTLEELCRDREATGANLKLRVHALREKVVLPAELLDGLDDLRLLGNDAAHVESSTFDRVGKEEMEVSIEMTKELLKAVYQYSDLLARIRRLQKKE